MLGRWGAGLAALVIYDPRTITHRPHPREFGQLQEFVRDDPTLFRTAGEGRQQGMGGHRHGADQGFRWDPFSTFDENIITRRAGEAGVLADLFVTALEDSLGKFAEVLA